MLSKFRFFRGIVSARIVSIDGALERLTRTPVSHIPIPDTLTTLVEIQQFRAGWRSCEFGRNIYDNPYSNREALIYSLHRAWEYGFTECFNNRRVNRDEEVYLEGWATAQLGLPLNENPHTYGSNQFNMWYIGWNDFVDNH
jgi:hypothetical protein